MVVFFYFYRALYLFNNVAVSSCWCCFICGTLRWFTSPCFVNVMRHIVVFYLLYDCFVVCYTVFELVLFAAFHVTL